MLYRKVNYFNILKYLLHKTFLNSQLTSLKKTLFTPKTGISPKLK